MWNFDFSELKKKLDPPNFKDIKLDPPWISNYTLEYPEIFAFLNFEHIFLELHQFSHTLPPETISSILSYSTPWIPSLLSYNRLFVKEKLISHSVLFCFITSVFEASFRVKFFWILSLLIFLSVKPHEYYNECGIKMRNLSLPYEWFYNN